MLARLAPITGSWCLLKLYEIPEITETREPNSNQTKDHRALKVFMNPTLCRSFSNRPLRPLLGRYQVLPYDVFRVQSGPCVSLRDYQVQKKLGRRSYDLQVGPGGIIQPSVGDMFNGKQRSFLVDCSDRFQFSGPNGCSVRPKGLNLDEIIDAFKGSDTRIYRLPEGRAVGILESNFTHLLYVGLNLPQELVLLHEHTDHHALQCTVTMSLEGANIP
jgi:hypothetical protein